MPRLHLFLLASLAIVSVIHTPASAQTAQHGADMRRAHEKLQIEYVGYRQARYETEKLIEPQNERPNEGGLVFVYLTNVSDQPVQLAYYRVNGEDASYWLLGDRLAWDRVYDENLAPGAMTVLELNALTDDFAPGQPFKFAYVDRTWRPAGHYETELREDSVQISLMRFLPGMKEVEVHVRHTGDSRAQLSGLEIVNHKTVKQEWRGDDIKGPGYAIVRAELDPPLQPSELAIARIAVEDGNGPRPVYAHRRAFADVFPIGVWSGNPDTYALLRRHHVDTLVEGGTADNEFYLRDAEKYGFTTMCPTGKFTGLDTIRSLENHPAVLCWMLSDEPDWSTPGIVMLHSDACVRHYNKTKPTFITLCRNVKFFEYGTISDIPCMDHYAVTAPTSSRWPHRWGTRLEETAYYTRDLKAACEPKPVWIWSQAIANWSERPQRPVPTPEEMASQLLFNLGRGAKGILWFNYDHAVAERYPDARAAMQRWGRVMQVVRPDLLAAEPIEADADAPDKIDVATLVNWDAAVVIATNLDYKIDPKAYPFTPREDVKVTVTLPGWIRPETAMLVSPEGVEEIPFEQKRSRVTVDFGDFSVGRLVVLANDPATKARYEAAYQSALAEEEKTFE